MNDGVISVLVVDDHKLVRQGICALLEIEPKVMVVGQAANADEAVRLASQLCPDVVLLDYSLPGIEGDQVIRQLRSDCPGVRILVLSCHADAWHIEQSLRAGALGYVTNFAEASGDSDRDHFLRTLGEVGAKTDWQVRAYCLMSNHFHLVKIPRGRTHCNSPRGS
jgi:chemotaxis response regulator CheB